MSKIGESFRKVCENICERFLLIFEISVYFLMDAGLAALVAYVILGVDAFTTRTALHFGVTPTYLRLLLLAIEAPIAYHVLIFVWRDFIKCLKDGKDDGND